MIWAQQCGVEGGKHFVERQRRYRDAQLYEGEKSANIVFLVDFV